MTSSEHILNEHISIYNFLFQLHLLREANITFIANHANERGGAMSVISPSVGLDTDVIRLFNTRCFIQYDVNNTPGSAGPSEWNVSCFKNYLQVQ